MYWQCCCNDEIATSKLQLLHEVAPTLRQLCKQLKICAIHGHMVKFPQLYLKIVEKFIHDIIFIWCAGSTLWLQVQLIFPFHTVLQMFSMFLVSKDLRISKLMSYSLVDWKMSFPSLDFWSILTFFFDEDSENQWTGFYMIGASVMKELKTTTFKESFVINHRHNKSRVKFPNWKRFNNKLVPS